MFDSGSSTEGSLALVVVQRGFYPPHRLEQCKISETAFQVAQLTLPFAEIILQLKPVSSVASGIVWLDNRRSVGLLSFDFLQRGITGGRW